MPSIRVACCCLFVAVTGCAEEPRVEPPAPVDPPKPVVDLTAIKPLAVDLTVSWPTFHGDHGLRGVSPWKAPKALTASWTFKNGGPCVIDAGEVIVGGSDGTLRVLGLEDGVEKWSLKIGGGLNPPTVVGDRILLTTFSASVHVVDRTNRKELWKADAGDEVSGSAGLVVGAKGQKLVVVGSHDHNAYAFELDTGKPAWSYDAGHMINGGVAAYGPFAIFGGCDASLHVVDADTGQAFQQIGAGSPIAASPAVAWPLGVAGTHESAVIAADLSNGKDAWSFGGGGEAFFSTPAISEAEVVIGGRDGAIHCIERKDGKERWAFATNDQVDASPVIAGSVVLCGSNDGMLYLLSLDKGEKLWSYDAGSPIAGSVAVVPGRVLLPAGDGTIHSFTGPK